jgi:anti-sigma factor RsiW
MRCEEFRQTIEETRNREASAALREHLGQCAACAEYARDWRTVRAGLDLLSAEPAPEPRLGFAARVLKRLEESTRTLTSREELLERAGRRMVYATLFVVLALVLALVVPTSGPVRAHASAELFPMEPAVMVENNPILIDDSAANLLPAPSAPVENGGKATQ